MYEVLVIDTSVLVDLERGLLITEIFLLPFIFVVPDLLYHKEIIPNFRNRLLELGLEVRSFSGKTLLVTHQYHTAHGRLISFVDCATLALASSEGLGLLTGDKKLRNLAEQEDVACHGVLWVFDQFYDHKIISGDELTKRLKQVSSHPRARLPIQDVQERLCRYSSGRVD